MTNEELRELRTILTALAMQNNLLQWVTHWAVGKNEGGLYVSLFHERLQFRVCAVYQERFRELPAFIRDNLPEDGDAPDIPTDRTKIEAADRKRAERGQPPILRPCTPFQIARYTVGEGDKAKFVFSGVVRVARENPSQEQAAQGTPQEPKPAPPPAPAQPKPATRPAISFATKEDAIHYGCQRHVYATYAEAEAAYERVKQAKKPATSAAMFGLWVEHVESIVAATQQFNAGGSAKPGPPAPRHRASKNMAALVAQPNYAG